MTGAVRACAVAGLGLVLTAGAGSCGVEYACTAVGGTSFLEVSLEPAARAGLASLRLDLCQAEHCEQVTFATGPADPAKSPYYVTRGVFLTEDGSGYRVQLGVLGRGWKPGTSTRLVVRGVSATGRTVVRRTDTFRFEEDYPNGKECDVTPYLSHTTRVGARDRTGS